jgi:2-aminoadipate transaminase
MSQYPQYTVPVDFVNLGVGQPATTMLPLEDIRKAVAHRFSFDDPLLLQYGDIPGYSAFREALAKFIGGYEEYKGPIDPKSLFITNGNTGALLLMCTFFTQTGDTVYSEDPSYFLAINTFRDFKLNIDSVPTDEEGLDVAALEKKLRAAQPSQWPKFIYTVTTFNNPAGYTLTDARRRRLVELSEEFGFLILADEVYQLLGFGNEKPPPHMFSYDRKGTVVSMGSFSKILAPALRVGWIQAAPNILKRLAESGQFDSSGGVNPVMFAVVHSAIELGLQDKHVASVRKTLGENAKVLCAAIREHLPSYIKFREPQGGYFIWIEMPAHFDSEALWTLARTQFKVQFQPGVRFSATRGKRNWIRLSISFYDAEGLREGARRLGAAFRAYEKTLEGTQTVAGTPAPSASGLRVAVHGSTGRLGSLVVAQLQAAEGIVYAGSIGRSGDVPAADVVVDVSTAEGTKSLIPRLSGQRLVVGTTGDLPLAELVNYSRTAAVVIVPNFSVGVPLLLNLLREAKQQIPADWGAEVFEVHHTAKRDAPSGTAKRLMEPLGQNVPVHSIRLGDTIGEHTVWLAGQGERLELKHVATRREVFAVGAVRISRWLATQQPGLYHK